MLVTAPMETALFSCLFSLLILLTALPIDAVSAQCLSDHQSLLLQLKNELLPNAQKPKKLPEWLLPYARNPKELPEWLLRYVRKPTKLPKWSQNSDCCSWEGVTCKEGHVTGLDLSSEGIISAEIENSTLFNLQSLESLDLSENYFNSTIPARIGNLTNLNSLNLSWAGFVGQVPISISRLIKLVTLDLSYNDFNSTIPARIGNLTNLNSLNLSEAGFVGQVPISISRLIKLVTLDLSTDYMDIGGPSLKLEKPSLFMLIQNLTKLEELYLDGVNMSSTRNQWCQFISSSLPHLRVLSLSHCVISGPIDHSLMNLQALSEIRLDGNNLSSPVPLFLANVSNLVSLRLSDCELYGEFPKEIFKVPTLQTLDISDNELLQGSWPEFPQNNALQTLVLGYTNFSGPLPTSIDNLPNLLELYLSGCQFTGSIPSSLFKLSSVESIDLSDNQFSGKLEFPPNSMVKLTKLVSLDLSRNKFTGSIPSSLFKLSSVERIDLSDNQFSGKLEFPPNSMVKLTKPVSLDLSHNKFTGSIPSSLFKLSSLEDINLSDNQFSGKLEFPNPSSSMLAGLDLSSNTLEGPIPISIFNLKNLTSLSLSSNKLNCTIELDRMFQGLPILTYLDLSNNSLIVKTSGSHSNLSTFPNIRTLWLSSCKLRQFPYLKNQPNLVHLDLSDNQIHGVVPSWIWEVGNGSLRYLNLSHNYLVGMQEPYSIPNSMEYLDLHLNQLQGKIPILPLSAPYIDFSSNNLTSIPSGYNLSETIFLSLSNNSITGEIPDSICMASYLEVLDLSKNNLSGRVPKCLSKNSYLGVLNLQNNSLSGPLPNTFLGNCSLNTLDLNGNMIEGQIPKSLANCYQLEVLNLGNNNLIDEFPCFLMNISSLRVLVLRSNKLYGSIECLNASVAWVMLQIFDLAHNNFIGKLPGQSFAKWKAMMGTQPELNFLQFQSQNLSEAYTDSVTVTSKGLEMNLVKILTIFTSIDLSSNKFDGAIPKEIGELTSLYSLNLSSNSLSGKIPTSLGNLRAVESLDLSRNHLTGNIPLSLTKLNFLSHLNLSFNQLVGSIPSGSQFQTFSADSFMGNEGLCGFPLIRNCTGGVAEPNASYTDNGSGIDWDFLSAEIGFIVGFGMLVGPLVFCRRWRKWYFKCVDEIVFKICPLSVSRFYYGRQLANQNKGRRH